MMVFPRQAFVWIEWTALVASLGSLLLSISFAYGSALQQMFDSLYMHFFGMEPPIDALPLRHWSTNCCCSVRPFDVGDRILVLESSWGLNGIDSADEMIVEKVLLSLLIYASNPSRLLARSGGRDDDLLCECSQWMRCLRAQCQDLARQDRQLESRRSHFRPHMCT